VRIGLILAAMLLTLAVLSPGPADAKVSAAKACKKAKGKTVAKNRYGRVFRRTGSDAIKLYGCLYKRRGNVKIDEVTDDGFSTFGAIKLVRLSGRIVAYERTTDNQSCKADCPPGYDGTTETTSVFNLRKRAELFHFSDLGVRQLGVTSTGVLAWDSGVDDNVSVYKSDGSDPVLLDAGNIEAKSLKVTGLSASWLKDGAKQSAKIG
jgi:hypothetical protein